MANRRRLLMSIVGWPAPSMSIWDDDGVGDPEVDDEPESDEDE